MKMSVKDVVGGGQILVLFVLAVTKVLMTDKLDLAKAKSSTVVI